MSIRCLHYFGATDPHAQQYSVIVQSLLNITTKHAKERERTQRLQRKQASSDLFGLLPSLSTLSTPTQRRGTNDTLHTTGSTLMQGLSRDSSSVVPSYDWTIYDADFFALPWPNENDQGLQDFLQPGTHNLDGATVADIPLFPIYDQQTGNASGR